MFVLSSPSGAGKTTLSRRLLTDDGDITLSVSATNIPTEYELTYTVTFAVQSADKELLAPQTISLSKDYSFEERVLLAKEQEADILRAQMARELVSIAMRRLTRLK